MDWTHITVNQNNWLNISTPWGIISRMKWSKTMFSNILGPHPWYPPFFVGALDARIKSSSLKMLPWVEVATYQTTFFFVTWNNHVHKPLRFPFHFHDYRCLHTQNPTPHVSERLTLSMFSVFKIPPSAKVMLSRLNPLKLPCRNNYLTISSLVSAKYLPDRPKSGTVRVKWFR